MAGRSWNFDKSYGSPRAPGGDTKASRTALSSRPEINNIYSSRTSKNRTGGRTDSYLSESSSRESSVSVISSETEDEDSDTIVLPLEDRKNRATTNSNTFSLDTRSDLEEDVLQESKILQEKSKPRSEIIGSNDICVLTEETSEVSNDSLEAHNNNEPQSLWKKFYSKRQGKIKTFRAVRNCGCSNSLASCMVRTVWVLLIVGLSALGVGFVRLSSFLITGSPAYAIGKIQVGKYFGTGDVIMFTFIFLALVVLFLCLRYMLKSWFYYLNLVICAQWVSSSPDEITDPSHVVPPDQFAYFE